MNELAQVVDIHPFFVFSSPFPGLGAALYLWARYERSMIRTSRREAIRASDGFYIIYKLKK